MKKIQAILFSTFLLTGAFFFISCTSGTDKKSHTESEEENHHDVGEEHEHSHNGDSENSAISMGESKTWTPSGNGAELIKSDFHFITGSLENIKPKVIQGEDGASILELISDGTPTAFVFHVTYNNVGLAASLKRINFEGTLKLIHHAKSMNDYEFVGINGNKMTLGRYVNGQEKVFDESDFSLENANGLLLKVSAAGSHYKGYMEDKTITHGHGDPMEAGYVGLMLEGKGKIQLKSIEVFMLEEE